jgi:CBS domain-containing protein
MSLKARDIMDPITHTLHPNSLIVEAARIFKEANAGRRQRVFGIVVIDDDNRLVGMLSMYDILPLLNPRQAHILKEMNDVEVEDYLYEACRKASPVQVGDIMTKNVISVTPETHLLSILDTMIKKHIRRIPVLENEKVIGIVYLSKVFNYLVDRMSRESL